MVVTMHEPFTSTLARLNRLDAARWLASLAVVLLHCAAPIVSKTASVGSVQWLIANAYDSAVRWCVPVFVMISGALLLNSEKPIKPRDFYLRRIARIFTPLVFWSLFFLGWRSVLNWWDDGHTDLSFWPSSLLAGTPYYHLWYLYMMIGLYLITPLAHIFYQHSKPVTRKYCLAAIFIVAAADTVYRYHANTGHGFFLTWFIPYLGYFLAGRMIFDGELRIAHPVLLITLCAALTAWGVSTLSSPHALNVYFYDYFSVTVLVMSLAIFQWILSTPHLPALSVLAPFTFGIYLIHPLFLDIATRLEALPTFGAAWDIPLQTLAVVTTSGAACWLLRQHPITRKLV